MKNSPKAHNKVSEFVAGRSQLLNFQFLAHKKLIVQKQLSIPLPEMFFGNNKLQVANEHGVVFELSPVDALKFVDATEEGGNKVKQEFEKTTDRINVEKLKLPEPILFYDEVILFEDELADNGTAILNSKV
ncbi:18853_t:CDS:2, partial [Racocetra fulgida]